VDRDFAPPLDARVGPAYVQGSIFSTGMIVMAVLPILTAPDPRLKLASRRVDLVDQRLATLMEDMLETMYKAPGIGLAAPQVGVSERVIVMDIGKTEETRAPLRMVNPEIVWTSDERNTYEEGCLSVPEQYAKVVRPKEVRVRYLDQDGVARELHADGLLATVIQHEMDHLDGTLFIDHLSSLKRHMILRRLTKSRREAVA
jgi:peptide deformylase